MVIDFFRKKSEIKMNKYWASRNTQLFYASETVT